VAAYAVVRGRTAGDPASERSGVGDPAAGERALVDAAREGDTDAYAELVARHQGIAFRAAYLVCGSAADAEEAGQDAFVKAWAALDRFRPDASFRPWLLQIVVNEARNRRRSSGRRVRLELRLAADLPAAAPSAETVALAGEERERLLEAVGTLPEVHRLVIAARYFLGLSEAETAAVLDLPPGTVKSRHARALARLRATFEEERER
jgi:RNA polymerase sigma-70 factor (ECF subfamily)